MKLNELLNAEMRSGHKEDHKTVANRRSVIEQVWRESHDRRSLWQKILRTFSPIVRGMIRMSNRHNANRQSPWLCPQQALQK